MWRLRETQLLTIWQVWHLQINLLGLRESTDASSFPRQKLWWKPRRHNWSCPAACLLVSASAFCVAFRPVTLALVQCSPSGCRADQCGHVKLLLSVAAKAAESKVLNVCAHSRLCFTRWLWLHYNRSTPQLGRSSMLKTFFAFTCWNPFIFHSPPPRYRLSQNCIFLSLSFDALI